MLVVPRPGTISPWSSKATDIAHVCGLDAVRRLERGIAYRLQAREAALAGARLDALAPLLHDRMTEMALLESARRRCSNARRRGRLRRVSLARLAARALARGERRTRAGLSDDEIDYLLQAFAALAATRPTSS